MRNCAGGDQRWPPYRDLKTPVKRGTCSCEAVLFCLGMILVALLVALGVAVLYRFLRHTAFSPASAPSIFINLHHSAISCTAMYRDEMSRLFCLYCEPVTSNPPRIARAPRRPSDAAQNQAASGDRKGTFFRKDLQISSRKVCRPLQTSKACVQANAAKSFDSSVTNEVGLFGNSGAQNRPILRRKRRRTAVSRRKESSPFRALSFRKSGGGAK